MLNTIASLWKKANPWSYPIFLVQTQAFFWAKQRAKKRRRMANASRRKNRT